MQKIPASQRQERMCGENPWWSGPPRTGRSYRAMRRRAYFDRFAKLVKEENVRRAIVLMGPRRVGKTVLLQHMIQRLLGQGIPPRAVAYLSLDQPLYANLSIEEIARHIREASGLQKTEPAFLFLDEIQYLRDWERHLKSFVDAHPHIKCIASGSAAAALRMKSIESGAGRFTDFLLPPLTFHEFLDLQNIRGLVRRSKGAWICRNISALNKHFIRYMSIGGYPEVIFSETIQNDMERYVRSDIIEKVLLRDLPNLYGIRDIQELNSLFLALAWNTAQEVSLDGLSQESGVSKPTIRRYLEYLEAAFLIKIVHRVDRNAKRFQRANNFKVYLTSPAMRIALFGPIAEEGIGALAETAAFSQWFHASPNLYYARWKTGEVDIVHLNARQQPEWCVEVKWSDSTVKDWQRKTHLKSFLHAHPKIRAAFTTRSKTGRMELEDGSAVHYFPTSLYCYLTGLRVARGEWQQQDWKIGK